MRIIADFDPSTGHKYLIFLLIFMLAGCVTKPTERIESGPPEFIATGKIAFRSNQGNHTANFRWSQYLETYDVEIWGPLGQGRSQLRGNTRRMSVTRGKKLLAEGPPEDIMLAYLGWVMPIELLPDWLVGAGVDEQNSVREVSGWRVEFSRFTPVGDGPAPLRPGRLEARNGTDKIIVSVRELIN